MASPTCNWIAWAACSSLCDGFCGMGVLCVLLLLLSMRGVRGGDNRWCWWPQLSAASCLSLTTTTTHPLHTPQETNWTENYIKEVPVSLLRPGVDTEDT